MKQKDKEQDPIQREYHRYINSQQFKLFREIVLQRDNYTCRCCGRTEQEIDEYNKRRGKKTLSLQVHHSTYDNIGKTNDEEKKDCITLCNICHRAVHSAKSNLQRFKDKSHILENLNVKQE